MFHEEISNEGITEVFIRKMNSPFSTGKSKKIIGIENLPLLDTKRVGGGHLLEGPRYGTTMVKGKKIHLIFFSTGDFPTKNYATRVAYSLTSIDGPYTVIDGDLTKVAEEKGLHGVGRAFPFNFKGRDWIIFHGAKDIPGEDHTQWPSHLDNFRRCLFTGEIQVKIKKKKVQIKIL